MIRAPSGFIVIRDGEGRCHLVRPQAITLISERSGDSVTIHVMGSEPIYVNGSLEEVGKQLELYGR